MPVTKAIFVVAGFGTRFLPATKAQPKEMLPIVNKPIIQYLVEEAVEAGIKDIIFVTGRGKASIENHFDVSYELQDILAKKGKNKLLDSVKEISDMADFAYVRQPVQKGDGHAILCAKPFVDHDEPVLMVFPDYLMPKKNNTIKKMIEAYESTNQTVIATDVIPMDKVSGYGVLDFDETGTADLVKVNKFVEKPKTEDAPSNLISIGYAILTPETWPYLQKASDNDTSSVGDGEIRVADAWINMIEDGHKLFAVKPQNPGYDCGSIIGFLKATVDFGLEDESLRAEFVEFMKSRVEAN
jgi:UTP--glucose-1-phosphate uridylyltransferase